MSPEGTHEFQSRGVPILGFVSDRLHQDALHLRRDTRVNLARARILAEIKYQQRIVLRIRAGKHMENRGPKGIDVRARLHFTREQLWRRIAHRSDRGHALLGRTHDTGDAKINQHHAFGLIIQHQVGRLEITVDTRRLLSVDIVEHVTDLNRPLADSGFVYNAAADPPLLRQIATADRMLTAIPIAKADV